jgi:hypothetical protein
MTKRFENKSYPVLLLGVIGALIGMGILLYDYDLTPDSLAFVQTPEFTVWLFLIATNTTFFAIAPILLLQDLKQLRTYSHGNTFDLALAALLLIVMIAMPLVVTQFFWAPIGQYPLAHHRLKVTIILALGAITTAIPAAIGIWLVRAATNTVFARIEASTEYIQRFGLFRNLLMRFTTILGTAIGLATLGTGAARLALIRTKASETHYPSTIVLAYGAYFTLLVVLVYLPTFLSLQAIGRKLHDAFFPQIFPSTENWADIRDRRKYLEELLQLQVGAYQSLHASIVVLAPLISSIISTLLG